MVTKIEKAFRYFDNSSAKETKFVKICIDFVSITLAIRYCKRSYVSLVLEKSGKTSVSIRQSGRSRRSVFVLMGMDIQLFLKQNYKKIIF